MKSKSRLKVYWPNITVAVLFIQSHYISIVKSTQYLELYEPLFELALEHQSTQNPWTYRAKFSADRSDLYHQRRCRGKSYFICICLCF